VTKIQSQGNLQISHNIQDGGEISKLTNNKTLIRGICFKQRDEKMFDQQKAMTRAFELPRVK